MGEAWATVIVPGKPPRSADASQQLDTALLVTSCERLKHELLAQLGLPDQWRGTVDLKINSAMPEDTEPLLNAIFTPTGWRYELDLPAEMKPDHLTRALVHVMLLEMANRNASEQSSPVPLWLVEGMMAQLQSSASPTLMLQENLKSMGDRTLLSTAENLRFRFRGQSPLTFQELSWPTDGLITNKDEAFYRMSAQLFVYELLQFKDGRLCMSRFLGQLSKRLNWQLAFLESFQPHFASLRDVEKWWGLTCFNVTGRSLAERWTGQESGEKIQKALTVPVRVHVATNRLPDHSTIPLQEVILRWTPASQTIPLENALATLTSMRPHLAPEFLPILDEYSRILDTYLHAHTPKYLTWIKADNTSPRFQANTCKELSAVDQQLTALRIKLAAAPNPPQPAQRYSRAAIGPGAPTGPTSAQKFENAAPSAPQAGSAPQATQKGLLY